MSTKITEYMQDGACPAARAVLALMGRFEVEDSWEDGAYQNYVQVARWENCREQGYICSLRLIGGKQLNIAFFEHRNSDAICALKWEQYSLNSITLDTANFGGEVYKDKWDTSYEVSYNEHLKMAEWIQEQFTAFYEANHPPQGEKEG